MTHTDRDKRIAEALGLCWHNIQYEEDPHYIFICTDCGETFEDDENLLPNFSTFDGMGLILQKGPEKEWWQWFIVNKVGRVHGLMLKKTYFIEVYYLQDPDKLADELYQFLKEETK